MATITGTGGPDLLNGTGDADSISGLAGDDTLTGEAGADTLDGGLDNDSMAGGVGDDLYRVDSVLDVVTEDPGAGIDTVQSSVSHTLAVNVEKLVLTGSANLNGTGNTQNNTLTGNSGNNVLDGASGHDTMLGGAGNDTYVVNTTLDTVTEDPGAGIDTVQSSVSHTLAVNVEKLVLTGSANLNGTGNTQNNTLTGNSGNNVLDGASGHDTMLGGAGDDTYVVNTTLDTVTEDPGAGIDTVQSSVSHTLAVNVEKLVLTGSANLNGTGNTQNNTLTGNSGNNVLDGASGHDTMLGGAGNDTYVVNTTLDTVTEDPGAGIDTVQSSVSHTLAVNVEKLVLTGSANLNGTGNTQNNTLTGNSGNNVLDGASGHDTMLGGAGNDTYVVNTTLDTVTEDPGAGTDDTVQSSVSHTLAVNVEKLVLTGSANLNGTGNTQNNTLTGNSGNNVLDGASGHDTMLGGAGNDTMIGGAGNDTLVWDGADGSLQGGTGTDTLRVDGAGKVVNLTTVPDTRITDVEVIDLTGSGNNTLTLAGSDVLALSSTTNTLRVDGDAGDAVNAGMGWTQGADQVIGPQTYAVYTRGGATLQVDVDVDRSGVGVISPELALSSLNGANGFRISGEASGDFSGASVSGAGDVNGDGFDDLIIGAWGADQSGVYSGASYVVFGQASGFAANLNLSTLSGANGFQLSGVAFYDFSGKSVSGAGDVNGDGFDDVIVGAPLAGTTAYNGAAYVVFGQASGFAANLSLSLLNGTNGFRITGVAFYDYAGVSVSGAGDVNGDGFDDLIVGAAFADPNGSYSGASYVVFGQAGGFGANLDLSSLNGANGFRISGVAAFDYSGTSVSSAGDVNGDGFDDLIVGAPLAGTLGAYNGAAYVVFGQAGGFAANLNLSSLNGVNGFRITGVTPSDFTGFSVSGAGDVNGDGFDDLIVGAYRASPNGQYSGASYVVFGQASGFGANLNLSTLNGANGFRIEGALGGEYAGFSVSGAGDVNGDGFDDLIVGAYRASPNGQFSGASYVVFGQAGGFAASLDVATLDGTNGFRIEGVYSFDLAGFSVSGAGDVNGDGFDDLIVGARFASGTSSSSGASYVVYGDDFTGTVDFLGTTGNDTLTGTAAAENFVSDVGNDTLTGGGGADVFRAGAGNDSIHVSSTAFADVDGGAGTDTLFLTGSALTLNLTTLANSEIAGIERVDLTGSGNNTLTLAVGDVLDLSDSTDTLRVDGNTGDTVRLTDGPWVQGANEVIGANTYRSYTSGLAELLVDTDVAVVKLLG